MPDSPARPARQPLYPDVGVLALVPEPWSPIWSARHQVLHRLARYFHVVWFSPPRHWRDLLALRIPPRGSVQAAAGAPDLLVYTPEPWLPRLYRPASLARMMVRQRLRRARQALTGRGCRCIVLYLWRPEFAEALDAVAFDLSCYHIEDEYSFSDVDLPLDAAEARLIAEVGQVFIHSPGLLEKKGGINPHTAFAPNGVDYGAYSRRQAEPADMADIPHPRIGYTGLIKRTLDWPLLSYLSRNHPDWSFVLVGAQHVHPDIERAVSELSAPNVHFLGRKTTWELTAYPQHFDVCIMPYARRTHSASYGYPLKLHEYLASGRPAVGAAALRTLHDFADVVALADTPEEWSAAIAGALSPAANAAERRAQRQAVARRYDWDDIVAGIARTMAERLGLDVVDGLAER